MSSTKRTLTVSLIALFVVFVAAASVSAKDKAMSGKELYKEYCKRCHTEDSPNGEYTPMTLIQDQWADFFDNQMIPSHEDVTDPYHDDKPVLELLTPEEMKTLRDWTIDHAADSEHPMTCG